MRALTGTVVAVAAALALAGCAAGGATVATTTAATQSVAASPAVSGAVVLPDQSATAAGVAVTVSGAGVDPAGFRATVALDTHEGSLDGDLSASTLTVAGAAAGPATWQGDPPGSHHRSGQLTVPGVVAGPGDQVVLTVAGLPEPVVFTWTVPAGTGS